MTVAHPRIYVAVPALDEQETLPAFIGCMRSQSYDRIKLFICVNQPDSWWEREEKKQVCLSNRHSLEFLKSLDGIDLILIDRSSKGRGWSDKRAGVGQARKALMDAIILEADPHDLIVSLDADTTFGPDYFSTIVESFRTNPHVAALAVPYYHRLTGNPVKDRAILRYELFMRYYAINLWRIGSPYSFTAIGSAIALPVSSFKAIGGITPHKSGEDFYFMQKLRKFGPVLTWNPEKVYPAARYSDRVGFGTGPAMIRGSKGDWKSYPIYAARHFDEVRQTYDLFPVLFTEDHPSLMDRFIRQKFGDNSIWQPLRKNSKTAGRFTRACHLKLDAFRVLQFLRWKKENKKDSFTDEHNLFDCLIKNFPEQYHTLPFKPGEFSFRDSPVEQMDFLRDLLAGIEEDFQKTYLTTAPF